MSWTHPQLGVVSPAEFIPIAEKAGLIGDIGLFMLEAGISALSGWHGRVPPVDVSINVSVAQLRDDEFVNALAAQLATNPWRPGALTKEITQSLPMQSTRAITVRLAEVRSLGVNISVDDYGVAYSSDERIELVQATEVKFDRSLIASDRTTSTGQLRELVARHHDAGRSVVAEGIETAQDLARVTEIGCDRAQGYSVAAPMELSQLQQFLTAA